MSANNFTATSTMSTVQFAFLAALLFIMSVRGHEECLKKDMIKVTGAGKGSYKTTVAVVILGVLVKGTTASEVQKQIGLYSSVLVEYLHGKSVDKLKTGSVALWKHRRGFAGNLKVKFESTVNTAGEILEGAMVNGATSINAIGLKGSEEDIATARDDAIKDAMVNARSEAEAAANASERELIAPATVDVTNMFIPRAIPATHGRGPIQPTVQLVPEEQSATALVAVYFSSESLYEYEEYDEEEGEEEGEEGEEEELMTEGENTAEGEQMAEQAEEAEAENALEGEEEGDETEEELEAELGADLGDERDGEVLEELKTVDDGETTKAAAEGEPNAKVSTGESE